LVSHKPASAQNFPRELRAIWLTTAFGLDFPKQNYDARAQKKWLIALADSIAESGLNTVFFQVKPMGDALYPSDFSPWSAVLTGTTGQAPELFFDPLQTFIEAAHERDIEVHAWFNPFRLGKFTWQSDICIQKFPLGHFFQYKEQYWLDPGHPESRNFASKSIAEVVQRYDIDGVHLDDYFYPYRDENEDIPDDIIFQVFGGMYKNKEEWRRQNVTDFIRRVHSEVKKIKPYLKFGVSPFGIWQNKSEHPEGSETKAKLSAYRHVYADAKLWVERKLLDYICPQMYFSTADKNAPFEKVLQWWDNLKTERHIYAGLALYRVGENGEDPAWSDAEEIARQIRLIRVCKNVHGFAFFRLQHWQENSPKLQKSLGNDFSRKTLPPEMPWIDFPLPPRPFVPAAQIYDEKVLLSWAVPEHQCGKLRFCIEKKTIFPDGKTQTDYVWTDKTYQVFEKKQERAEVVFRVCSKNRIAALSEFSEKVSLK
jgi:uncharacterized lipoprotein YddW (UPF0748 family)